jgi:hypothetical protein
LPWIEEDVRGEGAWREWSEAEWSGVERGGQEKLSPSLFSARHCTRVTIDARRECFLVLYPTPLQ